MAQSEPSTPAFQQGILSSGLAGGAGLLLAIALLKFGTPSVLEGRVSTPANLLQAIFAPWPIVFGYVLLGGLAIVAVIVLLGRGANAGRSSIPGWIFWMPLVWFAWQLVAAMDTVSAELTQPTVLHLAAVTLWFYVGVLILGRLRSLELFQAALLFGFCCMLWSGVEQRFSGLEQMRDYFYAGHDVQLVSDESAREGRMRNGARSDAVRVIVIKESGADQLRVVIVDSDGRELANRAEPEYPDRAEDFLELKAATAGLWGKESLAREEQRIVMDLANAIADEPLYAFGYTTKLASNRIWATMFYPNALAGAIVLLLPWLLSSVWRMSVGRFETSARCTLVGLLAAPSLACVFWSGSKTGILLVLAQGLAAMSRLPIAGKVKIAIGSVVLIGGLAGFFILFSGYFIAGATSLGARADYWKAAVETFKENPMTGTGPGTFMIPYGQKKADDAEMARLSHNDYLEQASDSGLIGFVSFSVFIWASLILLYRKSKRVKDWQFFLIWLGLAGWSLQVGMEFSLYIPALSWPAFLMFGLLWGRSEPVNAVDK